MLKEGLNKIKILNMGFNEKKFGSREGDISSLNKGKPPKGKSRQLSEIEEIFVPEINKKQNGPKTVLVKNGIEVELSDPRKIAEAKRDGFQEVGGETPEKQKIAEKKENDIGKSSEGTVPESSAVEVEEKNVPAVEKNIKKEEFTTEYWIDGLKEDFSKKKKIGYLNSAISRLRLIAENPKFQKKAEMQIVRLQKTIDNIQEMEPEKMNAEMKTADYWINKAKKIYGDKSINDKGRAVWLNTTVEFLKRNNVFQEEINKFKQEVDRIKNPEKIQIKKEPLAKVKKEDPTKKEFKIKEAPYLAFLMEKEISEEEIKRMKKDIIEWKSRVEAYWEATKEDEQSDKNSQKEQPREEVKKDKEAPETIKAQIREEEKKSEEKKLNPMEEFDKEIEIIKGGRDIYGRILSSDLAYEKIRNFYLEKLGWSVKYNFLHTKAWIIDREGAFINEQGESVKTKKEKRAEFKTHWKFPNTETPIIKFLREQLKKKFEGSVAKEIK